MTRMFAFTEAQKQRKTMFEVSSLKTDSLRKNLKSIRRQILILVVISTATFILVLTYFIMPRDSSFSEDSRILDGFVQERARLRGGSNEVANAIRQRSQAAKYVNSIELVQDRLLGDGDEEDVDDGTSQASKSDTDFRPLEGSERLHSELVGSEEASQTSEFADDEEEFEVFFVDTITEESLHEDEGQGDHMHDYFLNWQEQAKATKKKRKDIDGIKVKGNEEIVSIRTFIDTDGKRKSAVLIKRKRPSKKKGKKNKDSPPKDDDMSSNNSNEKEVDGPISMRK